YARFAAGILNADISHRPFPYWLIAVEVVAGVLLPMLVALGPVLRAARVTVREALGDAPGAGALARAGAATATWLPRPLAVSLRAMFRRRVRLTLAVGTLAIGGAAFMSALNVAAAWTRSVERDFAGRRYDLTAAFEQPQPVADVARALAVVPG